MFKPETDMARYFAMFVGPPTFCALRLVCRSFRTALSDEHECYYRARVKNVSSFKPNPKIPGLSNYREVFAKIVELYSIYEGFCDTISTSNDLIELVLKTPSLLDRLFNTERGPSDIIYYLSVFPSCHKYVIHDPVLPRQFAATEKEWANSFIHLICSNAEVYNSFLESELMMSAVALAVSEHYNNYTSLCSQLKRKYHVEKKYTHAVKHVQTPRPEPQLYFEERSRAVYSLLKSLRPVEAECQIKVAGGLDSF